MCFLSFAPNKLGVSLSQSRKCRWCRVVLARDDDGAWWWSWVAVVALLVKQIARRSGGGGAGEVENV